MLSGALGADTILGGPGNDKINGGSDNDSLIGESGADTLTGGQGNDVLDGGLDNDIIYGEEDNDILIGGAGADALFGNRGDDVLNGGYENDTLVGGPGADIFYIWSNKSAQEAEQNPDITTGFSTITDFTTTVDLIHTPFSDYNDYRIEDDYNLDAAQIYRGDDLVAVIQGVGKGELTQADFVPLPDGPPPNHTQTFINPEDIQIEHKNPEIKTKSPAGGGYLEFSGKNNEPFEYVVIKNSPSLSIEGEITVSSWIYRTENSGGDWRNLYDIPGAHLFEFAPGGGFDWRAENNNELSHKRPSCPNGRVGTCRP